MPRTRKVPTDISGCSARADGSVLIAVLWSLTVLAVVVIGALHTARLDLMVVKNHGDQIQAHYLALAGVEKAKALLYHDAADRRRSAQHHSGALYDDPTEFRDNESGRGQYRVYRQARPDERMGVIYGVSDEESRLNLNSASAEELGKLEHMDSSTVAAIVDYRDSDNTVSPGGAESDFYAFLPKPYLPRNGPFQTVRELLMVHGISAELFFAEDANQNGLLDPEEDDGNESFPRDNADGVLDAGWSGHLTVQSAVELVDAAGEERLDIQSADEAAFSSVEGISADLAKAIVAYRNEHQLENLADLLDVTPVRQQVPGSPPSNAPQSSGPTGGGRDAPGGGRAVQPSAGRPPQPRSAAQPQPRTQGSNAGGNQPSGPTLISERLLMDIADYLTVGGETSLSGAVNINTASLEVLAALPGMTRETAQAVIRYRQSSGFFPNVAYLLEVPGINRGLFKQLAPRVSVRSETFRILSEGLIPSTGTRKRIEMIVRVRPDSVETLAYREDL